MYSACAARIPRRGAAHEGPVSARDVGQGHRIAFAPRLLCAAELAGIPSVPSIQQYYRVVPSTRSLAYRPVAAYNLIRVDFNLFYIFFSTHYDIIRIYIHVRGINNYAYNIHTTY